MTWWGNVFIALKSFSSRHDVVFEELDEDRKWRFIGFYGSFYAHDRRESWDLLCQLGQHRDLPWLVVDDFNEIMYACEKMRGLPRDERRTKIFRDVLKECHLINIGYFGTWFTWERGNLMETNAQERLHRRVACVEWMSLFPTSLV